jgi:hypothetical protein
LRLRKAAEELKKTPDAELCIIGGKRLTQENGEAHVAAQWFRQEYPPLGNYVRIVRAESMYTAGDLIDLVGFDRKKMQLKDKIILVTHPDHGKFMEMTLRACGIRTKIDILSSGEDRPYGTVARAILSLVYWLDPCWQKWPSSPLRKQANKRYYLD